MGKTPQRNEILETVYGRVGLSERKTVAEKIMDRINDFVDTYER